MMKYLFAILILLISFKITSASSETKALQMLVNEQAFEIKIYTEGLAVNFQSLYPSLLDKEARKRADIIMSHPRGLNLMRETRSAHHIVAGFLYDLELYKPCKDSTAQHKTFMLSLPLSSPKMRECMPSWLPNDDRDLYAWIVDETERLLREREDLDSFQDNGIRGGFSREDDKLTARPIIKALISSTLEGASEPRLNQLTEDLTRKLINDPNTWTGFAIVGDNVEARKMYIGVCAKILMHQHPLTVTACIKQAQCAVATFNKE